jgi:hypothetical protein
MSKSISSVWPALVVLAVHLPFLGSRGAVRGTIESYDGEGHVLTLKTQRGERSFDVSGARLWIGPRSVEVGALLRQIGAKATVRFRSEPTRSLASTIRVTP